MEMPFEILWCLTYNMTNIFEPSHPQHISDDIPKDSEEFPIKRRYTGTRDF